MKQLTFIAAIVLSAAASQAANWPNWRGPNFNGTTDETGLPAQFSKTEHVAWTATLPGQSGATPAIWGDNVFVSSVDDAAKTRVALCLDRKTGKVRWQSEVGPGASQDNQSTYSSASPVTDGKVVWFFYGNGDLVCFDLDGKKVWSRNIQTDYGKFAFLWTFSTSPVLYDGRLYMQVLQRDMPVNKGDPLGATKTDKPIESFLLALDPATGKELWKVARPSDARMESRESFTTPMPFAHGGRTELLVVGGDCISGHDMATGRELWRWGTWNPQRITHWRLVPSPAAGEGVALACAPKGGPITAVKLGLNGKLDDSAIAWQSPERELSSDVPTPLFYKGRFYVLNGDKKKVFCVEPKTGKTLWSGDLDTRAVFQSSPTAADDKLYMMDFKGNVFVVSTAPDGFKLLHTAAMGDEGDNKLRASVAISQGQLFIRTGKKLYCVAK
jgi:outer membrane protein assembly factor BamB